MKLSREKPFKMILWIERGLHLRKLSSQNLGHLNTIGLAFCEGVTHEMLIAS